MGGKGSSRGGAAAPPLVPSSLLLSPSPSCAGSSLADLAVYPPAFTVGGNACSRYRLELAGSGRSTCASRGSLTAPHCQ